MIKLNFATVMIACLIFAAGCTKDSTKNASNKGKEKSPANSSSSANGDVHDHPSEGPHHGTLTELGNEEFHAELVHDEKSVTIYILDSAAKKAVPIDAAELTINILHDGTPEQFKLAASPDSGDPSGKSSRFTLADEELAGHIEEDAAAPKLTVTINGTPYRGEIKHDHDGDDNKGHKH